MLIHLAWDICDVGSGLVCCRGLGGLLAVIEVRVGGVGSAHWDGIVRFIIWWGGLAV